MVAVVMLTMIWLYGDDFDTYNYTVIGMHYVCMNVCKIFSDYIDIICLTFIYVCLLIFHRRIKTKQLDIESREVLARNKIYDDDIKGREKIKIEKAKLNALLLKKERTLSYNFRRIREKLEQGIRKQLGEVKEQFGRLLVHQEVCYDDN